MAYDPYLDLVVFGSAFDGADGAKTAVDIANSPLTQTWPSSGAEIDTARAKYGVSSIKFSGSGLRIGGVSDAAMAPGSEDCCYDCWVYDEGGGQRRVLFGNAANGGSGWSVVMFYLPNDTFSAYLGNGSVENITAPLNVWYHLAVTVEGGVLTVYINGSSVGSGTITGAVNAGSGPFALGAYGAYEIAGGAFGTVWYGHVDDFRFTKGNCRWTGNFTPPTGGLKRFEGNLSGNTKDSTNTNAAVLVRAYREDTGALVGETTSDDITGLYSITTEHGNEHTMLFYPTEADSDLNALVRRGVLPIEV